MGINADPERKQTTESNDGAFILIEVGPGATGNNANEEQNHTPFSVPSTDEVKSQGKGDCDNITMSSASLPSRPEEPA